MKQAWNFKGKKNLKPNIILHGRLLTNGHLMGCVNSDTDEGCFGWVSSLDGLVNVQFILFINIVNKVEIFMEEFYDQAQVDRSFQWKRAVKAH